VNLSKSLAQEFGPGASMSTAFRPVPRHRPLAGEHGVAETVTAATGVDADTTRERIIAGIGGFATGRFTTPEEVATLITLPASERAGNVTGATKPPTAALSRPPSAEGPGSPTSRLPGGQLPTGATGQVTSARAPGGYLYEHFGVSVGRHDRRSALGDSPRTLCERVVARGMQRGARSPSEDQ
jgi:hypothetical protein